METKSNLLRAVNSALPAHAIYLLLAVSSLDPLGKIELKTLPVVA